MAKSRREFITATSIGLIGAAAAASSSYAGDIEVENESAAVQRPDQTPAGAPPAFGGGPAVGPEVTTTTFSEAEKLAQIQLNDEERAMAAGSWRRTMAGFYERRSGPRKVAIE